MQEKLKTLTKTLHPTRLNNLATYLLKDEAISGKLIIIAVVLALAAANSPLASLYESFWRTHLSVGLGEWALSLDLREWISEGLMAIFFLVVGLELSRELDHGELKEHKKAVLPLTAALGGMLVPAAIYTYFNIGTDTLNGWAIPIATDIALAIGLLALVGKHIPSSVRIFLLTLAIVDDIIAVILIGVFYSSGLNVLMLVLAAVIIGLLRVLRNAKFMKMPVYIIAGIALWVIMHEAGIHASITGAILGLLAPLEVSKKNEVAIAERIERAAIPLSTLIIVPLFAFANTGIALNFTSLQYDGAQPIALGIIFGLAVGKVTGVLIGSWLVIKLKLAAMPKRMNYGYIAAVGIHAGIGFTVSIFITQLAFSNDQYIATAKMSIFIASIISAVAGMISLRFVKDSPA